MAGKGRGWVTAEYGMLPASTGERKRRDVSKGRPDGRSVEIQRLIGRSLRGVIDFKGLGERTVWIDCDVLEADGGTRCAAITGGYVALELALRRLVGEGKLAAPAADPVGGGGVLRRRRRPGAARPRLLRGLHRRGGRQRGHDRRRRARRGAGHRRAHAALARLARRAARPGGRRHRAAARGPAGGRGGRGQPPARAEPCGSSSPPATSTSCASWRSSMRPIELEPLPDEVELPPETGTTFAENALAQGARGRRGHGPGRDRRRLGHRGGRAGRRAGGVVGALRRRRRDRRGEPGQAAARGPGRRRHPRGVRLRDGLRRAGRRRGAWCTGAARGGSPTSRAAAAASATTRPSCPTTTPATSARWPSSSPEEKDAISHRGRAARALELELVEAEEKGRPRGPMATCSGRAEGDRARPPTAGRCDAPRC